MNVCQKNKWFSIFCEQELQLKQVSVFLFFIFWKRGWHLQSFLKNLYLMALQRGNQINQIIIEGMIPIRWPIWVCLFAFRNQNRILIFQDKNSHGKPKAIEILRQIDVANLPPFSTCSKVSISGDKLQQLHLEAKGIYTTMLNNFILALRALCMAFHIA